MTGDAMGSAEDGFDGDPEAGQGQLFAGDILEMLELRSSEALPGWLAGELAGLYGASRGRVLRVLPGAAARSRSAPRHALFAMEDPRKAGTSRLVESDALLDSVIREGRPWCLERSAAGTRLLLTLSVAGRVRFVVELRGMFDAGDGGRIAGLAAIATRYFERLIDAETDPLTQLFNRRAFQSQLDSSLRRGVMGERPWYFAVLDIDHFKRINDAFGHLYGDEILVRFARLMRETFRATDLMYRFGGEEFVVLYGVDDEKAGETPLERFRAAVERHPFPGGQVTVSAGHARIAGTTPISTLIDRADVALYYAKTHGRNRVCGWEKLVAAGELEASRPKQDVTLFDRRT
jgi:diguanylate cyclase (GGDEF)-like protein